MVSKEGVQRRYLDLIAAVTKHYEKLINIRNMKKMGTMSDFTDIAQRTLRKNEKINQLTEEMKVLKEKYPEWLEYYGC